MARQGKDAYLHLDAKKKAFSPRRKKIHMTSQSRNREKFCKIHKKVRFGVCSYMLHIVYFRNVFYDFSFDFSLAALSVFF